MYLQFSVAFKMQLYTPCMGHEYKKPILVPFLEEVSDCEVCENGRSKAVARQLQGMASASLLFSQCRFAYYAWPSIYATPLIFAPHSPHLISAGYTALGRSCIIQFSAYMQGHHSVALKQTLLVIEAYLITYFIM
jgi:hypothetical protein